jgi:cytochrome b involved in lipid metabolism
MENFQREITLEELKLNDGENRDLWVLIHDKVYDLTNFKHPGGKEILMDPIGEDRGDEFDSIHSPAVKEEMKKYFIGRLKKEVKEKTSDKKYDDADRSEKIKTQSSGVSVILVLILLLVVAFIVYKFNLIQF